MSQIVMMKAYHIYGDRKVNNLAFSEIAKWEPDCTVVIGNRYYGSKCVPFFLIGSGTPDNYSNLSRHNKTSYVIDTAMGYKGSGYLRIQAVVEIRRGKVVTPVVDGVAQKFQTPDRAPIWVMK